MESLSLTIRKFNDKVKQMNQTNGKQLVLSAEEARSLHNDIYAMLTNIAELASNKSQEEIVQISMDGGSFK
jgi:hypothetical protein